MQLLIVASIAMLCYLGATGMQSLSLAGHRLSVRKPWFVLACFAILLHAFVIYRLVDVHGLQNLTYINVTTLIAWMICLITLLTAFYQPIANLSVFLFPFAIFSILLAIVFPGHHLIATDASPEMLVHIWLAVIAFSVLAIAAIQAVFMALQQKLLRLKRLDKFLQALPPVETMERVLFRLIMTGFVLLSAMLATSFIFFNDVLSPPWLHQTILSLLAWLVFAFILFGRYFFGWRGKVAIRWTCFGVLLLVLAYFGTALLESLFHI